MKRVLVIGGGISGLTLAHAIAPVTDCTLVEADNRLGGKILTVRDDPFTLEAGPDCFLTAKPAAVDLCESLGLADRLVDTRSEHNRTYVVRRRTLHELPGGLTSFVPTRWGPFVRTRLLSPLAKLRMAMEPLIPRARANGDPTFADFFVRRLGAEAYHWLVEPVLAGIYAGRGSDLSLRATLPRFLDIEREHGSLLRASLAARRSDATLTQGGPGGARGMFQTLQGGLCELVDALCRVITSHGKIKLGVHARAIEIHPDKVCVHLSDGTWEGEAVALCVPAYESARLLQPIDSQLASLLACISYASTVTISVALLTNTLAHPLDGHGFVVPRVEGRSMLACTWTSQKWPHRAPAQWHLLRAYLGGAGRDAILDVPDDVLVEEAVADLSAILGTEVRPAKVWVHRWERSLPQYVQGHLDRLQEIEQRVAATGSRLHLVGASYRGVGIPDCITDGQRAARLILSRDLGH